MKYLLLLLLPLAAFRVADQTYCNSRFDYCVRYPERFIAEDESASGDGNTFRSPDGRAVITAYGSLVVDETLAQHFRAHAKGLKLTYQVSRDDWYLYSGYDQKGRIVYHKTLRRKIAYLGDERPQTWVYQTVEIAYPAEQQELYQAYCGWIAKGFK